MKGMKCLKTWSCRSGRLALVLGISFMPIATLAGSITTPGIIATTVAGIPACMKWAIVGICFWLKCGLTGCSIETSIMVGNYNPDLVVSAYHRTGENPWLEMAALYGGLQKAAGQAMISPLMDVLIGEGDRPNDKFHRQHKDLIFKEADAIGHPINSLRGLLPKGFRPIGAVPDRYSDLVSVDAGFNLVCPSETSPFLPYLLSTLDLMAWRFAIPETVYPQALIPGLREIGHWPLNTWGAVYPRQGFVIQSEDPKAGAVAAQRAGDIVTRTGQPHVYRSTASGGSSLDGMKVWRPGPLKEVDRSTGYWQMLVPHQESGCAVFGINDTLSPRSWADGKVDAEGDYAWNLWRPYKCCKVRGQTLLFTVQWMAWPP